MDDIRDIDDLKDGIKAILTSLSGKCTENEFKDVFEEFFNCKISEAYKLCGGKAINFKDFLNKMSDICSYKKQDNGEIFITKVWNKDSKHVDMLNKVTKKDIYKNNDQVNKNSSIKKQEKIKVKSVNNRLKNPPTYVNAKSIEEKKEDKESPMNGRKVKGNFISIKVNCNKNMKKDSDEDESPSPEMFSDLRSFIDAKKKFNAKQTEQRVVDDLCKSFEKTLNCDSKPNDPSPSDLEIIKPKLVNNEVNEQKNKNLLSNTADHYKSSPSLHSQSTISNLPKSSSKSNLQWIGSKENLRTSTTDLSTLNDGNRPVVGRNRLFGMALKELNKNIYKNSIDEANDMIKVNPDTSETPNLTKNETTKVDKPFESSILKTEIPHPKLFQLRSKNIHVKILELVSPSEFVLLFDKELEELKLKMTKFYKDKKLESLKTVEIGSPVAVKINDEWLRGEVIMKLDDLYDVKLVDVNVLKTVEIESLFLLDLKFFFSSRKALKCSLAGIIPYPYDKLWSWKAIMEFKAIADSDKIKAVFKSIEDDSYKVDLIVMDEMCRDLNVAGQLIMKNVATFKE